MSAIDDDLAWFEQNRAFINQNYNGQWVLIQNKTIVGAYATDQAALTAGFSKYAPGTFIIKQALAEEPVHRVLR